MGVAYHLGGLCGTNFDCSFDVGRAMNLARAAVGGAVY